MRCKSECRTHIRPTYIQNTTIGIKVWALVSLGTIQGLCHPTTILHCNETCLKLDISTYKLISTMHFHFTICITHLHFAIYTMQFPLCISTSYSFHFIIFIMHFHYAFPLIHGVSNFKWKFCEWT